MVRHTGAAASSLLDLIDRCEEGGRREQIVTDSKSIANAIDAESRENMN